jgi:DNA-directed RNA polymerase subunit RPC12/RpoP
MQITEVVLDVFDAKCVQCGASFELYRFPDFEYGRRILRTKGGTQMALLNCEDKVVEEVSSLIQEVYRGRKLRDRERGILFNKLFGLTCDPLNSEPIDATQRPVCPHCGSSSIQTFERVPRTPVRVKLPIITHEAWEKKSRCEKLSIIEGAFA